MADLSRVVTNMVRAAKARATKKGVPFNITPEDITIPSTCPVLGIPLVVGQPKATDNSPSLDRVVPLLGYVKGNVIVISNRANRIKNNASVHELRAVANFFEQHITGSWMQPKEN
jgi:hypothetical protein